MKKVSVREAKAYLSRLFEQISTHKISAKDAKLEIARIVDNIDDGEEVLITRDGEPVFKLVPLD